MSIRLSHHIITITIMLRSAIAEIQQFCMNILGNCQLDANKGEKITKRGGTMRSLMGIPQNWWGTATPTEKGASSMANRLANETRSTAPAQVCKYMIHMAHDTPQWAI